MTRIAARLRTAIFRLASRRCGVALAGGVGLLSRTWRYHVTGSRNVDAAREAGRGVVYCFWHGRMLELAALHAGRGIGVLISDHPDGRAAARIAEPMGYAPIPVASPRGPVSGVRTLLRHAASGRDLALAPDAHSDGYRARSGVVRVARLSGHALVPVAASARPRRRVASWDRFEIPWPGARVHVRYGPPPVVPDDAGAAAVERARRSLEATLFALHADIERKLARRSTATIRRWGLPARR